MNTITEAPSRANRRANPWTEIQAGEGSWMRAATAATILGQPEIGCAHPLTPWEEVALARRVQAGDQAARERMIQAHLHVVVNIACEYENLGLSLLELVHAGDLGLITAVDQFDADNGVRFSQCSLPWIKRSIRKALARQTRTIRLPGKALGQVG